MTTDPSIEQHDLYDDWEADDHEQLPPRPRRQLIAPLPLALLAVLIAAIGFIGGVLVQRGQQDGGSAAAGAPNFAAARAAAGGGGGAQGQGSATVGEVASIKGKTLYVTDAQGNTIAVKTNSATNATRTAEAAVRGVKPGDTVIVQGAKRDDGSVRASSVTATAAGAQANGGQAGGSVGSLFQP